MTGAAVGALLARLSLDELGACVEALPGLHVRVLQAVCEERALTARLVALASPPVVTGPPNPDEVLTAEELAAERHLSLDTVYRLEKRGMLIALPRPRGGRLRFRRGDQPVVGHIDPRYTPPHDTRRRKSVAPPPQLDATPVSGGVERDGHDGCAMGARRAERVGPRRDKPWAPGQNAWRPGPPKG